MNCVDGAVKMASINIEIDNNSWQHKAIPNEFVSLNSPLNFDLADVLLHIGYVTKNPNDYGMTINDYWAFLRYNKCFYLNSSSLQLKEEWNDVDAHQKTILSDDFGMGFASYFLHETVGVKAIIDTRYFLKHMDSLSVVKSTKKGTDKTPDFIVLDNSFKLHVLECKGTQNSINSSEKQINTGSIQKTRIDDPNNIVDQSLVISTYIATYHSKDLSRIKIVDPEYNLDFSKVDLENIIERALIGQFAKEMHMLVFSELANYIADFNGNTKNVETFKQFIKLFKEDVLEKELESYFIKDYEIRFYIDGEYLIKKMKNSKNMSEFILDISKDSNMVINENIFKGLYHTMIKIKKLQ